MPWFAIRQVIATPGRYQERITVWEASTADEAFALAERSNQEVADLYDDATVLDFGQSFEMFEPPGAGREVFSLIRRSTLEPDEYVEQHFATGGEVEKPS